jgi:hypothetical protein
MCGGAAAHDTTLIGFFRTDPFLHITSIRGEILERLDCLPSDLQGHGWEPFVAQDDFDVTRRMAKELQAGRTGTYDLRALTRHPEPVLHVRIRTFVVRSGIHVATIHGVLDLLHSEPRRTILLLA